MLKSKACEALAAGKVMEVLYDGYTRGVEIHAVGETKDGNAVMRVWQVRGGSVSGEVTGWKLLRLDEARGGSILEEASQAPRPGYKRGDSAMAKITCQV